MDGVFFAKRDAEAYVRISVANQPIANITSAAPSAQAQAAADALAESLTPAALAGALDAAKTAYRAELVSGFHALMTRGRSLDLMELAFRYLVTCPDQISHLIPSFFLLFRSSPSLLACLNHINALLVDYILDHLSSPSVTDELDELFPLYQDELNTALAMSASSDFIHLRELMGSQLASMYDEKKGRFRLNATTVATLRKLHSMTRFLILSVGTDAAASVTDVQLALLDWLAPHAPELAALTELAVTASKSRVGSGFDGGPGAAFSAAIKNTPSSSAFPGSVPGGGGGPTGGGPESAEPVFVPRKHIGAFSGPGALLGLDGSIKPTSGFLYPMVETMTALPGSGPSYALYASVMAGFEGESDGTDNIISLPHSVNHAIRSAGTPVAIAAEGVSLQYAVDSGLDEVLKDMWMELFTGEVLPPNPYPSICLRLKRGMLMHDMYTESDDELSSFLLSPISQVDLKHSVWSAVDDDAAVFGTFAAVRLASPSSVFSLLQELAEAAHSNIIRKLGSSTLSVSTGLGGKAALYGKLYKYVTSVTVVENYYVAGPDFFEALELFVRNVFSNILFLHEETSHLVRRISVASARWTPSNMKANVKDFIRATSRAVESRKPITLELLFIVGRSYVLMTKEYRFHHLVAGTSSGSESAHYAPDDKVSHYFALYFSAEKASAAAAHADLGDERDPEAKRNVKAVSAQLRHAMGEDLANHREADALEKLAMFLAVRKQDELLPSLARVLNSPVARVRSLAAMARVLRTIVKDWDSLRLGVRMNIVASMIHELSFRLTALLSGSRGVFLQGAATSIQADLDQLLDANKNPSFSKASLPIIERIRSVLFALERSILFTMLQLEDGLSHLLKRIAK